MLHMVTSHNQAELCLLVLGRIQRRSRFGRSQNRAAFIRETWLVRTLGLFSFTTYTNSETFPWTTWEIHRGTVLAEATCGGPGEFPSLLGALPLLPPPPPKQVKFEGAGRASLDHPRRAEWWGALETGFSSPSVTCRMRGP